MHARSLNRRHDPPRLSSAFGSVASIEKAFLPDRGDGSRLAKQLLDIFSTRGLLEERAARLAACHLTKRDAQQLAEIVRAMEAAARRDQTDELIQLDRKLHFTIYRAAGRPHLQRIIEQLWTESAECVPLGKVLPDLSPEGRHVLRSIVSACEQKDENALGIMVRYKLHRSATQLIEAEFDDSSTSQ